jgi:hypothetical protein
VKFEHTRRRTHRTEPPSENGRIPRITRLLALAHRVERMIRAGELRDWAEAAQLLGITRARMTQIANLLLLAPEIQEAILNLPPVLRGHDPVTEPDLRAVTAQVDWRRQELPWMPLRQGPNSPSAA